MVLIRNMRLTDEKAASKVTGEVMLDSWEKHEKGYYPRHALDFDVSIHSSKNYTAFLKVEANFMFVAEEDGEIVGVAQGSTVGASGLARLNWIGVKPDHQQMGVGTALLEKVIGHCKSKVCHKITLYTMPVLVPAINLYLKSGFVPEAFLRKEWWNVDFVKMSKWL